MQVFLFGIRVLAQFVDRLIEWSQYCIRIVQISHLRSSHPELVAFVERALSRVSPAHASHSSVADGYANDIEAEATLHFHQMFSGQLTSHAMIQMLAHFKGSADNRSTCFTRIHVYDLLFLKAFSSHAIHVFFFIFTSLVLTLHLLWHCAL